MQIDKHIAVLAFTFSEQDSSNQGTTSDCDMSSSSYDQNERESASVTYRKLGNGLIVSDQVSSALAASSHLDATCSSDEQNEREFVCMIRRHPTRVGLTGMIVRPLMEAFNVPIPMPGYSLPGGFIYKNANETINKTSIKGTDVYPGSLLSNVAYKKTPFLNKHVHTLAKAAIQVFIERTSINLNSIIDEDFRNYEFSYLREVRNQGEPPTHYFQLHFPELRPEYVRALRYDMKPGKYAAAVSLVPVDNIELDRKTNPRRYMVCPQKNLQNQAMTNKRGIETVLASVNGKVKRISRLDEKSQDVQVNSDNAEVVLNDCVLTSMGSVYKRDHMRLTDFTEICSVSSRSHDSKRVVHKASGVEYILKNIKEDSTLYKNIQENATRLGVTFEEALNRQTANEILANRLYQQHGIRVPNLEKVETEMGFIVATEVVDGFSKNESLLKNNPSDSLYDGVGCDIAFANYNVTRKIGFTPNDDEPMRISFGGALAYRAGGLLKSDEAYSDEVDIDEVFSQSKNARFHSFYTGPLDSDCIQGNSTKYKRSIAALERITDYQRKQTVHKHAYGSKPQKRDLADHINKRIRSTISGIKKRARLRHYFDGLQSDERYKGGNSLLHVAVLEGNYDEVMRILQDPRSSASVNQKNIHGDTPLHVVCTKASEADRLQTILLLLQHGANPHIVNTVGLSPIHYSIRYLCETKVSDYLMTTIHLDYHGLDIHSQSLFHHAALSRENTLELMKKLVDFIHHRFDPGNDRFTVEDDICQMVNEKDYDGDTPLHFLVKDEHENFSVKDRALAFEYLLKNGALADVVNNMLETVLHRIAQIADIEMFTALEAINANDTCNYFIESIINARDIKGNTPLHYALESANLKNSYNKELIQRLVKHGAKMSGASVANKDLLTPMHYEAQLVDNDARPRMLDAEIKVEDASIYNEGPEQEIINLLNQTHRLRLFYNPQLENGRASEFYLKYRDVSRSVLVTDLMNVVSRQEIENVQNNPVNDEMKADIRYVEHRISMLSGNEEVKTKLRFWETILEQIYTSAQLKVHNANLVATYHENSQHYDAAALDSVADELRNGV